MQNNSKTKEMPMARKSGSEKISRGNAGQFRVASELCRRGYSASITLGNTPNTDILCASKDGLKSVCIQVKTFRLGASKCLLSKVAEDIIRKDFIWIFLGLDDELTKNERPAEFYIVPADVLAPRVRSMHSQWLKMPPTRGKTHKDTKMRQVSLDERISSSYNISEWRDRWECIEAALEG